MIDEHIPFPPPFDPPVRVSKARQNRRDRAMKHLEKHGGAEAPLLLRLLHHLCQSRLSFTAGLISDHTGLGLDEAIKACEKAWHLGWCYRVPQKDGSPKAERGDYFYVGRL